MVHPLEVDAICCYLAQHPLDVTLNVQQRALPRTGATYSCNIPHEV
jgi:hypothetical protein